MLLMTVWAQRASIGAGLANWPPANTALLIVPSITVPPAPHHPGNHEAPGGTEPGLQAEPTALLSLFSSCS